MGHPHYSPEEIATRDREIYKTQLRDKVVLLASGNTFAKIHKGVFWAI